MKISKNADNLVITMSLFQKIALSLLLTLVIFSAFLLMANSFVFENLEAKFYKQTKISENTAKLNEISQCYNEYFSEFLNFIGENNNSYLNSQDVRSYYEQNPSEVNVAGRRIATEALFSKYPSLKGIRIIDKNGRNVHFSTFDKTDVFQQKGITKTYKNYDDICKKSNEIAFADLEKNSDILKPKFLFDEMRSRVVISAPFNFTENIFSGYAFFYFDFIDLQTDLAEKNNFEYNVKLSLFSDSDFSGVFVQGVPEAEKNQFKNVVLEFYKKNQKITENKIPEKLLQIDSGKINKKDDFWVALSDTKNDLIRIAGVYKNTMFEIPQDLYFAVLLCIFISLFLILFLILSLKRDSTVVLKTKIKKLQLKIIQECFESGEKINFEALCKKLESRKNDFSEEIAKSLKIRSKKKQESINLLLKKNWDEIFSIFQVSHQNQTATQMQENVSANLIEEIRKLLQEMLKNTEIKKNLPSESVENAEKIKMPNESEEISDAESVEEVDEVDLVEEVEELGEIEEICEVELVGEIEELGGVELVEELDEAEPVGEVAEIDEVEKLGEAEEICEVEPVGEIEELGEVEPVAEVAEVDLVEEVEELGDVESVAEVAELAEVESADEVAELEPLDEKDEIIPLEPILNPLTFEKLLDTETFLKIQPNYTYALTNETYFASDNFATVDNVFAEEICLGDGVSTKNTVIPIDFKVYKIEKYWNDSLDNSKSNEMPTVQKNLQENSQEKTEPSPQNEDIEDLTEEIQISNDFLYFSMTNFAENITSEIPMLDAANIPQGTIVQEDGIFSISQYADYKNSAQDKDFKALVDSVI